ncbi:hypothetical protein [Tahibacter sp.]|uniref:hypothetical protein n=1 Tax=Tahibacter sp. TaxID=2056211 RepID=UPI0028C389D0|nr:hypothetical protein [Tahibacter sp.]
MTFWEALNDNAKHLAVQATLLSQRIDTLRSGGHSADASIDELFRTCEEIGRLNKALERELENKKSTGQE